MSADVRNLPETFSPLLPLPSARPVSILITTVVIVIEGIATAGLRGDRWGDSM